MILSIDPSTSATGIALWCGCKLVDSYALKIPKTLKKAEKEDGRNVEILFKKRVLYIDEAIENIISAHDISQIVIEDQYLGRSVKSLKVLVEFRAAIETIAAQNGVSVTRCMPSEWQRYALGSLKKGETKAKSVEKVYDLFGISVTHDEADAILIGWWYINRNSEEV